MVACHTRWASAYLVDLSEAPSPSTRKSVARRRSNPVAAVDPLPIETFLCVSDHDRYYCCYFLLLYFQCGACVPCQSFRMTFPSSFSFQSRLLPLTITAHTNASLTWFTAHSSLIVGPLLLLGLVVLAAFILFVVLLRGHLISINFARRDLLSGALAPSEDER